MTVYPKALIVDTQPSPAFSSSANPHPPSIQVSVFWPLLFVVTAPPLNLEFSGLGRGCRQDGNDSRLTLVVSAPSKSLYTALGGNGGSD